MKPPVITCGDLKGKLVVLVIIFTHINIVAVRRNIVKRAAFWHRTSPFSIISSMATHIATVDELLLDQYQIFFLPGDIQGGEDCLQMLDQLIGFFDLLGNSLESALELIVPAKIFIGILCRCQGWIDGDRYLFVVVIINTGKRSILRRKLVSIGMDQFPIYFITVPFFCILELLLLNDSFFSVSLQQSGNILSEICGFLADPLNRFLFPVKSLHCGAHGILGPVF